MRQSLWNRVMGHRCAKSEEELPAGVEQALRAARPEAPDLDSATSIRMLASALATAGMGRRAPRSLVFGVAIATSVFVAAVGLMLTWRAVRIPMEIVTADPNARKTNPRIAVATGSSTAKMKLHATVAVGSAGDQTNLKPAAASAAIAASLPEKRRAPARVADTKLHPRVLSYSSRRRLLARISGLIQSGKPNNVPNISRPLRDARQTGWEGASPVERDSLRSPFGRMIVIVSESRQGALDIEVSDVDVAHLGFARAAAYRPIGPGGGVFTQCTVHENAAIDEISTAEYGIVYGQLVSRLTPDDNPRPADELPGERGLKP